MDERAQKRDSGRRGEESVALGEIPLHSTNLLTLLDEHGIVQYESPAIEQIYGFEQDALVGEQVASSFHPDDRERVLGAFETVVASEDETVETVEYRHECVDGSYCWVESAANTTPTPQGYYVINTRDITAQKERETALIEQNERLEEFARVLSHDLRNPLQVAVGHLELAAAVADNDHLAEVGRAHRRMEALIDDLLALARTDAAQLEAKPVHLAAIVADAWWHVDTGSLHLDPPPDVSITANRTQLQQLLENLFRNAAEHAGDDVTVTVGVLEDGFYVEDDGRGIPDREREHVFERNFSTAANGTGIGLQIVDRIVTAHDWSIELRAEATGGVRFEITGVERPS